MEILRLVLVRGLGDRQGTYVPRWCSIIGLGGVVPPFPMSTKEQNFVLDVRRGMLIQIGDLVVEALPLSWRLDFSVVLVCGICAADQAKVLRRLNMLVDPTD